MINRRAFLGAAGAAALTGTVAGCGRQSSSPEEVRIWGLWSGEEGEVERMIVEDFLEKFPDRTIRQSQMPESSTGDATYAITAVRGGTAPDLWIMGRDTIAQFASLGLVEPLSSLIEEHESADFLDQWAPFALDEVSYDGQVYGLPFDTDTRGLFYNKETFREAGLDPDELDPSNGPITVERMLDLNEELVEVDGAGNYTRFGLIPWDAEGWALTWMIGQDAQFFDNSTGEMRLTSPEVISVLEHFRDWAQEYSYPRIQAFKATYEPPNSPPAQTSFFGGQQAMQVGASVSIQNIRNYVPDLDFGVTYLPVWEEGDDPYTWSGGFSLVAPVGSSLSPAMWDFMTHYCGREGQQVAMNPLAKIPTQLEVFDSFEPESSEEAFMVDLLQHSISRPPFPVGSLFWDALVGAQESVLHGSATPEEAAEFAQARVAPQMEIHEGFRLPEAYGEPGL